MEKLKLNRSLQREIVVQVWATLQLILMQKADTSIETLELMSAMTNWLSKNDDHNSNIK